MSTEVAKTARAEVAVVPPARLPYHPNVEKLFGIDLTSWRALVESIFPTARTTEAVILALSYCKARHLDPFKRTVHIVPVWDSKRGCEVETVWPGIAELRTTACRTGEYAGRDECKFGPEVTETLIESDKSGKDTEVSVTYPQWAQTTIYRIVKGEKCTFVGPIVRWKETYATKNRYSTAPNSMWAKRPYGQLEKCADAASFRSSFPEEIGGEYAAEEVEGGFQSHGRPAIEVSPGASLESELAARREVLAAKESANTPEIPESSPAPESTEQQADSLFGAESDDAIASYVADFSGILEDAKTLDDCEAAWNGLIAAKPTDEQRASCRKVLDAKTATLRTTKRK